MKKRKTIALFLLVFTLFGVFNFMNPITVEAATTEKLEHPKTEGIYYTRRGGGKEYLSAQWEQYYLDGKVVYCIEPGVDITTTTYLGYDGLQASPYDDATNKKIELIGHYGYDYPGHQTRRYKMATQALIWETVGGQIVEFWTEQYGNGDYININAEKNEIMRLVNAHYSKPSFNGQTQKTVIGQEIKITDTNNLLSEYEIYKADNLNVRIEGNDIYITPLKVGKQSFTMVRKHYDNFTTIVYHGDDSKSQKMGYFRFSDPVLASFSLETIGGDVEISKLDRDTQSSTAQGVEASLEGAVYGIYDLSDNLIQELTTDSNGYAKSKPLPDLGRYYLQEITPSKGYELDENKYYFNVGETNLHPKVKVYEQIIKREVELTKYFASGETGILKPEVNIQFGIYDSNNNLVKTITTDEQGYAKTSLVYGTYTVKQLNTTDGHEKVKDFTIVINNESPKIVKYSLSNAPITAKLKLVKIDADSKKAIAFAGVTFKIKNVETGEYVCQKITYPEKVEVCEFKTDENGVFYTPYPLISGTYQLEEITSPTGYLLTSEAISFRIDEKSEFIEDEEYGKYIQINFANKKILGEIQIQKKGESLVIEEGTFTYEDIKLKGIEFALYANEDITTLDGVTHYKKGELVKKITTSADGLATFNKLYLGKYIVKETKTLEDYVLDTTEYEIELTEKDNITAIVTKELTVNNKLKKGDLEFTKTDLVNGEVIPNTLIEIYTENDELIFSGRTDEQGKIVIEELRYGKYYIIEKEAPEGYILNTEKMPFEIIADGEIVKTTMVNEKVIIDVPNTGITDYYVIEIISGLLVIGGIGVIIYAKKKRKK